MSQPGAPHSFAPPFSMRLLGGFRADFDSLPLERLETSLGVRLELADDLELGGAYYRYAPDPLPETGLAGVRLHLNDIPGLALSYAARPDLLSVLVIEWRGGDVLALGRLDARLEQAYPGVYDMAEYSVASLPPPGSPAAPSVHWVAFEAAPPGRGTPRADAPSLKSRIEFELPALNPAAVLDRLGGLNLAAHTVTIDEPRARLTLQFQTRSLLDLGRGAGAAEGAPGGVTVQGYQVSGDLLRDGRRARLEALL